MVLKVWALSLPVPEHDSFQPQHSLQPWTREQMSGLLKKINPVKYFYGLFFTNIWFILLCLQVKWRGLEVEVNMKTADCTLVQWWNDNMETLWIALFFSCAAAGWEFFSDRIQHLYEAVGHADSRSAETVKHHAGLTGSTTDNQKHLAMKPNNTNKQK